jgi:hypothetical protein
MTTEAKIVLTAQDRTSQAFRQVNQSLTGMQSAALSVRNALGSIGVGVSVAAIVTGFTRAAAAAINYGDEVTKAAARTGASASEFARLADAAKLADVDMATLSKGLRSLNVALSKAGSGEKGPTETFKALGLEAEKLRRLKPDQQLEAIADAIAGLRDPADRARAGTELFSRAWETLSPLMVEGSAALREATAEVERLGGSLSDAQIAKLADADNAIKGLSQAWSNFARTLTADVAPALTGILDDLAQVSKINFSKVFKEPIGVFGGVELGRQLLALKNANVKPEGSFGQPVGGTSFGTPVTVSPKVTSPGFAPSASSKKSGSEPQLTEVSLYSKRVFDQLAIQAEAFADINRETTAQVQEDVQSVINSYGDVSEAVRDGWIKSVAEASQVTSEWSTFAEQAARNIQDSFAQFLFDPFNEGVNGMLAGFLDTVRQMVAQIASQELLRAFFGWAGGAIGGGVGSFLSGLAPRAMGGPVTAGGAYLVGERGPEMFVPRSSGTIIPNGGGAPVTVNYSIDARGADASRIMAILPGMLEQTKRQTVAEVIRLQRQGRFA